MSYMLLFTARVVVSVILSANLTPLDLFEILTKLANFYVKVNKFRNAEEFTVRSSSKIGAL